MTRRPNDLTTPPDLRDRHGSGPVRTRRPIYFDLTAPCDHACPAGESVQAWLALVQAGDLRGAWEKIVEANPLPAVHGRVCYHPCETSCNRAALDAPVSIHAVERFLGDRALAEGWPTPMDAAPSGRRVLIVGAGPSGLSAAHHLARLGHAVEIREAGPLAGGMLHFGIPAYRLPRDVLEGEVRRIVGLGVTLTLDHPVTDLAREKEEGAFDAAFVAVGAHLSKRTEIPARDAGRMLDALGFLRAVEAGEAPRLGRRVAIYGGGNTAMDAARVAKRLGHEPLIIYRRDRAHMPAHEFEADEALEEGVRIHWLRTIRAIDGSTFTVEVMELDENGRPRATGRTETLDADDLILALGQDTDTTFLRAVPGIAFEDDGTVIVGTDMMTGHAGIFAGGDMVPAERTVTTAVGHGRRAAHHIDAWLRGASHSAEARPVATLDKLRLWYYTDVATSEQARLPLEVRTGSFREVVAGIDADQAAHEAGRCLSCGNCFECDACYAACPEDAILKLGPGQRYAFDYALCTGCAVCFEGCPCHAIDMIPEPAASA